MKSITLLLFALALFCLLTGNGMLSLAASGAAYVVSRSEEDEQ
jgi:hypothetical protein